MERKEYKEYIEQWIHEVKTPISLIKLIEENNRTAKSSEILIQLEEIDRYVEQSLFYARSEDVDKIEALDAGADDYITKPFSVDELLARIRVTQRRLALIQSGEEQEQAVFVNGELKIDYTAGSTYLKDKELHLTPIEYKLLCLLSHNVGKVLTHTYITQQIWGSSLENDVASLRVFMATLRKKLQPDKDGMQYIQTHIGIGYRMLKI